MALTQAALATKIKNNLETEFGKVADDPNQMDKFAQAMAKAIVDEIQANAVVNTTVTGTTATGPAGGPLPITSQPGVGTVS